MRIEADKNGLLRYLRLEVRDELRVWEGAK